MYQSLIWPAVLRHDARSLGTALHAEDLKSLADALIDRVGRDVKLDRDFLGRQMLVDEPQAVELPRTQASDTCSHLIPRGALVLFCGVRHAFFLPPRNELSPPQQTALSSPIVHLWHPHENRQFFSGFASLWFTSLQVSSRRPPEGLNDKWWRWLVSNRLTLARDAITPARQSGMGTPVRVLRPIPVEGSLSPRACLRKSRSRTECRPLAEASPAGGQGGPERQFAGPGLPTRATRRR